MPQPRFIHQFPSKTFWELVVVQYNLTGGDLQAAIMRVAAAIEVTQAPAAPEQTPGFLRYVVGNDGGPQRTPSQFKAVQIADNGTLVTIGYF